MTLFEVGKRVPHPFDSVPEHTEGAIFNMDAKGATIIAIYYQRMTKSEIKNIQKTPIQTSYIAKPPFWFGLIKIGPDIMELTFDPMLEIAAGRPFSHEFFRESSLALILGIDTMTMNLNVLRGVTYPPKFLSSLYLTYSYLTYSKFEPSPGYSREYLKFLDHWRRFSLEELWQKAEESGSFGDREI